MALALPSFGAEVETETKIPTEDQKYQAMQRVAEMIDTVSGVSPYSLGTTPVRFDLDPYVSLTYDVQEESIVSKRFQFGGYDHVVPAAYDTEIFTTGAWRVDAFAPTGSEMLAARLTSFSAESDTYYDIYYTQNYSIENGNILTFYGNAYSELWIYITSAWSVGEESLLIEPRSMQLLVDGKLIGEKISINNDSLFKLPDDGIQYVVPGVGVSNVGFRFYFDEEETVAKTTAWLSRASVIFGFFLQDNITVVQSELTQTEIIIQNIYNAVVNLPQNIYNYFFQGVDPSEGESLKEDAASKREESDQLQQEIEEGVEKPPPEEIVPDITVIIDQTDENYVGYMDAISALLSNSMIVNLLLIVVSMAFVSYVLFGKKE